MSEYEMLDPVERLRKLNEIIESLSDELAIMYAGVVELPPDMWLILTAYKLYQMMSEKLDKICRKNKWDEKKCTEYKAYRFKLLYGFDPDVVNKIITDAKVTLFILKTFSPVAQTRTALMYETALGMEPETRVQFTGEIKPSKMKPIERLFKGRLKRKGAEEEEE